MSARAAAPASRSERAFGRLVALFPREFRERFGDDMADLFRDQLRAARERGGARAVAALWLRTLPALARAAALEYRDALRDLLPRRSESMLATLAHDLRYAGRMLRKTPLFTAVAVLCISLGSGAVTTIFSAMNALVLRPLPGVADAGRLVRLERTFPGMEGQVSLPNVYYEHVRASTRSLQSVAAWSKASLTLRGGPSAGAGGAMGTAVYGNFVSGNFFSVLGVRPALGRFFAPEEDRTEGTNPVVVVSERFWRAHLGADSGAVGGEIRVNGKPFTLVGVAPAAFHGPDAPIETDAWVPLRTRRMLQPSVGPLDSPQVTVLRLCARLKEGVSLDAAREEVQALTKGFLAQKLEPEWLSKYADVRLTPMAALPSDARKTLAGFLGLLLGAAALVLLIASVNVAALLSARAVARRRELAVRAALGAARGRLVGQLLTEILLLFAFGAAGGAALALAATRAFERLPIPGELPIRLDLAPDPRVFAFALATSLLTGLVVGLAPARRAVNVDIEAELRDGSSASGARRTLLGNSLVVGQLALSLLLLVGAGLFARALRHGSRIDPGFDHAGVVTAQVNTEAWGYDQSRGRAFERALRERLASAPGVTAVSYANGLPLTLRSSGDDIQAEGAPGAGADGRLPVQYLVVDAGYFSVLRIPVLAGREIGARDDERAAKVAVVNQTLARRLSPGGDVVGHTFRFRDSTVTVVGVARDAKHVSLAEPAPALAYFPMAQFWEPQQHLVVRGAADPRVLAGAIRDAMRAIDADAPRPAVTTLDDAMAIGLLPQRVAALVTGALGAVGLLLATVGLYGIVAYSAGRRTREIGVRMALGARSVDVLRMVMGEGVRLTAVGVAIGLLLAAGATRLLGSLLVGVSPVDGLTYALMSTLFVAVALVASWLPARRAAAADPVAVLRGE